MPQRQGKRHGVRTNATIRRNEFERNVNRGGIIEDTNSGIPWSISKHKRWELLTDPEKTLPVRKIIPLYQESNVKMNLVKRYFPGGCFRDYDRARNYQSIDGKRRNVQFDIAGTYDEWINLPFKNHEYPLKRQLYRKHDTPCKGCLAQGGIFLFRGRGKKSSGKTKGMKICRRRDWQDEFNL